MQDEPASASPDALRRAAASHRAGNLEEAHRLYAAILTARPDDFDALHGLAVLETQRGRLTAADGLFSHALRVNPRSAEAHSNHVVALKALGRFEEALASCDRALAIRPRYVEALHNRGVALAALHRHDEALASFDDALAQKPDFVEALHNRGIALAALRRHDEALASQDRALAFQPRHLMAHYHRGVALSALTRDDEALAAFDKALALRPGFPEALNNRAAALNSLKRYDEALATCDRALAVQPDFVEALYNRGLVRSTLRQYEGAGADLERARELDPDLAYVEGMLLHARMQCCDWRDHADAARRIIADVRLGKRSADPLCFLALSDSAADQRRCAETWVRDRCPPAPEPLWRGERYGHDRIRLAYLSADFGEHAVAYLTAELFERHDRTRFDTTAVSFGPAAESPMRSRLQPAFGRFIDVRGQSDREVAARLRELEIDIAVDLTGFTADARTGILALRPAPVQVNYLGFPATMGAPYIDCIVADRFVVPDALRRHYAEEVVWLPDSFQANDATRPVAARTPGRAEVGLPAEGFVFCSFNSSYKITPTMFEVWMAILQRIERSVLWLQGSGTAVEANLRREAQHRGVEPARLVFAPRMPYAEHLARYRLADLFLDTLPFNAGTTASDALWTGLPVLTCCGEAFASRMAGSLLQAIGLPELATATIDAYQAQALRLATDAMALAEVKDRLARHRDSAPLFDSERFRHHLEAAYVAMWERHR